MSHTEARGLRPLGSWYRALGTALALAMLAALLVALRSPRMVMGAERPLREVPIESREVALTFDISWGTVMPPKVLTVLNREKVPATFFISGPWALQHPELVREIAKGGYEIESHGWRHVNYSQLANSQIAENIRRADDAIREVAGVRARFIRPPNGDYNKRVLDVAKGLGYTVVLWGTDSLDWMNPGVGRIISRVLSRVHPGDIVLLHASDTCKQTDLALPAIISGLRAKGYIPVTLRQLLSKAG